VSCSKPGSHFFLREATGLVKELSAFDVFVWSIIFFPWLTSWAGIFWVTPDYYLHVNYYAALGAWSIIAMVIMLLYWLLTAAIPRSGGDYVFVSRIISSPLGFIGSFLFLLALLTSAGSGGYWAFTEAGTDLTFAGQVLGDKWIRNLGLFLTPTTTSSPWTLFALSLLILGVGAVSAILGGKTLKRVLYALFGYGLLVLILVVAVFAFTPHRVFLQDYSDSFNGGVHTVFRQASTMGYLPFSTLGNIGGVIPVLFVSIGPYPVMQFVGGEIKNPKRSLLFGLVFAEAVSILVWFGLTYLVDRVIGISFLEALSVVNGYAIVPTAFVTLLIPNQIVLWIITVGLILGNIGWSWLAFIFISRIFFAWSFDRIIPAKFASVSESRHTPTFALIVASLLAVVPMYLEYFTSFITAQVNAIFFYTIVWFLAALSAALLPYIKKDVFELSPIKAMKVGSIPLITLLGCISMTLFAYLGYYSATNPAIGPFGIGAKIFTLSLIITAITIYVAAYYWNKRQGVDLKLLLKQVPPE
jgi:APA family basic amino acid/polyamine antiporter